MNQSYFRLELNKILSACADYAVLEKTRERIESLIPATDLRETERRIEETAEATDLLYLRGAGKVEYFAPFTDEFSRAKKGATLSCGELLNVAALLRSARVADKALCSFGGEFPALSSLTDRLGYDERLEEEIGLKILSAEEVSDNASERLYSLRKEIRALNERIREKLGEYLTGETAKYLQESIVTMRDDRYVLPVKTEYKRNVKGFVHDRSQTGATVFIEPEYVLELNNELRTLAIDEKEEVERILSALSARVGAIAAELERDADLLCDLDLCYARAEYGYRMKATRPAVNGKGIIRIRKGRHPLIAQDKVIPVALTRGEEYDFLLISGPNTGGKTVTLKMTGLFCLMAACGFFLPAAEGSEVGVFSSVFCDVGDDQSIEESLSTFSSHIKNIVEITKNADKGSLVLVDELGGGTDPEEGQALARAVVDFLLDRGCKGVVTTHYTALKEYAHQRAGIENASMEFDSRTLQPLYRIRIGLPGASNALLISRRLGLDETILAAARSCLSEGAKRFENILRSAEDTRVIAEEKRAEAERLQEEWKRKLDEVCKMREELARREENLAVKARAEARRVVNERAAQAEEILGEIEAIFRKEELTPADLIRARTLKNRVADIAYEQAEKAPARPEYERAEKDKLKVGDVVFVEAMGAEGVVRSLRADKGEAETDVGGIHLRVKIRDLKVLSPAAGKKREQPTERVRVVRDLKQRLSPMKELNVLGLTVSEAEAEIDPFLDAAVVAGIEEVKIVHGFGTGSLRKGIHEYLRRHANVESFRLGKYGEGEGGVTIVKLK